MLTGKIRNDIDKLWEKFWTGGITNPLTVIEQISYLMFARMLDMQEDVAERKASRTGKAYDRLWTCDFSYDYVKINGSYRT